MALSAAVLIVLVAGGVTYALLMRSNKDSKVDQPKVLESQDTMEDNSTTQPEGNSSVERNLEDNPPLPKPMLTKSSGNTAPIPKGVLVEFSCSGVVNTNCYITLYNQESEETLRFDDKKLKDDGRGQVFATWVWESKPGTWSIGATVTADGYSPSSSESQTLTVNQ